MTDALQPGKDPAATSEQQSKPLATTSDLDSAALDGGDAPDLGEILAQCYRIARQRASGLCAATGNAH